MTFLKKPAKQLLGKSEPNTGPFPGVLLALLFLLSLYDAYLYAGVPLNALQQPAGTGVFRHEPEHHNHMPPVTVTENRVEEDVKEEDRLPDGPYDYSVNFPEIARTFIHFQCTHHTFRSERLLSLVVLYHAWKFHIN